MIEPKAAQASAIKAVLFDKDGTLFDFQQTWGPFGVRIVDQLAAGEPMLTRKLAAAIGVDMATATYAPNSPVIAGSTTDIVRLLLAHLPHWTAPQLAEWLDLEAQSAGEKDLAPASADLPSLMKQLTEAGYVLGVATNDSYGSALNQIQAAGLTDAFAHIFGYDSVQTPKPAPDMVFAFAQAAGIAPSAIAMVGDSLHDLRAGRAAGCGAVIGVLTGPAGEDALTPMADAILPSIDALPEWLSE